MIALGTAIIIPVKDLAIAKSRLSPVLSDDLRQGLVLAMLADVLAAASDIAREIKIYVVSADPRVQARAQDFDATILADCADGGYNSAVIQGAAACQAHGHETVLVLPADLPLVRGPEIGAVISAVGTGGLVLAPSRDLRGTNALLLSPPDALAPAFGPDSFRRHKEAAAAVGLLVSVVEKPGLAFDIDTPQDLRDFCNLKVSTLSHRFLFDHGIANVINVSAR